ncbi:hypothetical protein Q5569_22450, partial [Escherichia coli]|nr:hypothetical protein [Escherichia coli]
HFRAVAYPFFWIFLLNTCVFVAPAPARFLNCFAIKINKATFPLFPGKILKFEMTQTANLCNIRHIKALS